MATILFASRRTLGLLLFLSGTLVVRPADAQMIDKIQGKLLDEAIAEDKKAEAYTKKQLMDEAKQSRAEALRLRHIVNEIKPFPQVLRKIAEIEQNEGDLVSAAASADKCVKAAEQKLGEIRSSRSKKSKSKKLERELKATNEACTEMRDELAGKLGVIDVSLPSGLSPDSVRVNDMSLSACKGQSEAPQIQSEPGTISCVVPADVPIVVDAGILGFRKELKVSPGQRQSVAIPPPAPPATRPAGWALLGTGAGLIVSAGVTGIVAVASRDRDMKDTGGKISGGLFVAGVVGLAAGGIVLWTSTPSAPGKETESRTQTASTGSLVVSPGRIEFRVVW